MSTHTHFAPSPRVFFHSVSNLLSRLATSREPGLPVRQKTLGYFNVPRAEEQCLVAAASGERELTLRGPARLHYSPIVPGNNPRGHKSCRRTAPRRDRASRVCNRLPAVRPLLLFFTPAPSRNFIHEISIPKITYPRTAVRPGNLFI